MIRRLFWLLLGAVLGVTGYRRAAAALRSLRPAPRAPRALPRAPRAESLAAFAADVREGMAIYLDRQSDRAPSTLEGHRRRGLTRGASTGRAASGTDEPKDGR